METAGRTRILIAGGGVAALEAALALRELAAERVSVEVAAPESEFVYRPLAVAEPFRVGEVRRFPLRRLTQAAGALLRQAQIDRVEPDLHVATTTTGEAIPYDLLLLALGARPVPSLPGAVCFGGPGDGPALARVLEEAVHGRLRRIVFALPSGATWPLPLYELALLTRSYLVDRGAGGIQVALVTPEDRPLGLFGQSAGDAVGELLEARGIELFTHTVPLSVEDGMLAIAPGSELEADRVISLPRLEGPRLAGVPHDLLGFVPTGEGGEVVGADDIYAAGDVTNFPLKQGGIATQQADAAAQAMAARGGAPVEPEPFRPVLRGLLLTGMEPRFLRAERGTTNLSVIDTEPLWWPPAKIVGKYLAPFLAEHLGLSDSLPATARKGALHVEVELDPAHHGAWSTL
jgi:sulfide:quinone oxidoreductase